MSVEEADWMVLSEARDGMRPWEVIRGRIATVSAVDGDEIVLALQSMSFRNSEFRFGHNASLAVSAGGHYVLDPMADDLVAERVLGLPRGR